MKTSENIKDIAEALSQAQSEITGAKKSAQNPFFKSHYANFSSVVDAIKEAFSNHGLSFVQDVFSEAGTDYVITRLLHKSGQWLEFGPQRVPVKDKENPQAVKSGVTYMKRTQLASACGLAEVEDDDGNQASAPKPNSAPVKASNNSEDFVTKKNRVINRLKELGYTEAKLAQMLGKKDLVIIDQTDVNNLITIGENHKK